MIKSCAIDPKNIKLAESLFEEIKQKQGVNNHLYTSLMKNYSNAGNSYQCMKIIQQMKKDGMEPDIIAYTQLMVAYKKSKNLSECWNIFDMIQKDE